MILNQCMAYFFLQNNKFSLHASCILKNNKAYLISGPSGSGKSSLAAILSKDYKVITEDLSVIENLKESYVYSSYPLIKLDPNKLNGFNPKKEIIYEYDKLNRIGYSLDNRFLNTEKTQIKKCIFIDWGKENKVTQLDVKNKFIRIFQNCFKPIPYDGDKNLIGILLRNISNFSKNVEITQVTRVKENNDISIIEKILD